MDTHSPVAKVYKYLNDDLLLLADRYYIIPRTAALEIHGVTNGFYPVILSLLDEGRVMVFHQWHHVFFDNYAGLYNYLQKLLIE